MARWNSANVLQTTAGGRRLWHLSANGEQFNVEDEATLLLNEPCPIEVVDKDWQSIFRPKLNVAWLPADKVYFRVVHLPFAEPAEVASMVELQMEKLSPLPVTQMVWSSYMLPRPNDKPETMQTVIVIVAARSAVEEFLGQLSTEGFQPDRLEAPGLEQFLAAKINEDGVWIFPGDPGEPALVAWWFDGMLQNITLIALSSGLERSAELKTQLDQTAWAGELEGWLTGPLRVHLVINTADAEYWEQAFKDWGEGCRVVPTVAPRELAALSAARCGNGSPSTSLLPAEFSARYHQQFIDRLWIRSLMAVVTIYVLGVLFYFGVLYIYQLQDDRAKTDLAKQGPSYTNALQHIEQIRILTDRAALKYAGLDCWKAVAENLPDTLTVDRFYFHASRLELGGTFAGDATTEVGNFTEALRTVTDPVRHEPLFTEISAPTIRKAGDRGEWSFNCTMKGGETK